MELGLLNAPVDPAGKYMTCTLRFNKRPNNWQMMQVRAVPWVSDAQLVNGNLVVTVVLEKMPEYLKSECAHAFCEALAAVMER